MLPAKQFSNGYPYSSIFVLAQYKWNQILAQRLRKDAFSLKLHSNITAEIRYHLCKLHLLEMKCWKIKTTQRWIWKQKKLSSWIHTPKSSIKQPDSSHCQENQEQQVVIMVPNAWNWGEKRKKELKLDILKFSSTCISTKVNRNKKSQNHFLF